MIAATAALAAHSMRGFPTLADFGADNDSLLRLVQVRDLLAGQGWFDLQQYRMGLAGGFEMHWSRLVDAPLAALIWLGSRITGDAAAAETIALVLWPIALYGIAVHLICRSAERAYGAAAALPALIIGGSALYGIGIFAPGAIDHHNVQVVLALGSVALLLHSTGRPLIAAGAGATSALMLATGAEGIPLVAGAGLCAAGLFLFRGRVEAVTAGGFGCGLAATSMLCFLVTVHPGRWFAASCDSFSVAHLSAGILAGLGLAAAASVPAARDSFGDRLTVLTLLGIGLAMLMAFAFPQCLADPYASLDPRLKIFWLDAVTEAQSVIEIAHLDPAMLAAWYATPVLAVAVLATSLKGSLLREHAVLGALLLASVLVSLWQVRGALFAIPLAAIILAGWIAYWRERARAAHGLPVVFAMAAAWLLSFNATWGIAAAQYTRQTERPGSTMADAGSCTRHSDYYELAALPRQTVLAVSNMGAPILRNTAHRVLAGPYHRNVEGNLAALELFMSAPRNAERLARSAGIGLIAICPGNSETGLLAKAAPGGLIAELMRDEAPEWLEPIQAAPRQAIRLYRLRP
jgi:hypothetical protein